MISSLNRFKKACKFRFTTALATRAAPPSQVASKDELDQLVELQTAYWHKRKPLTGATADRALEDLNTKSISIFVFEFRGSRVHIRKKPRFVFSAEEAENKRAQQSYELRATLYKVFLETAIERCEPLPAINLALDVNDFPHMTDELPVFGFQKHKGANNLLLPDVDFFHAKWYRHDCDALSYDDKVCSACFVGSSTGGIVTVEGINQASLPRLHAAAHFYGNPNVFFRIANAVHCDSEEAKSLLMRQPYFCAPISWEDQLRHRFIISMDGNGAACSRLVKGLRSNSVVVKFDSPHELYYFPALRPGVDHLVAQSETDLQQILNQELAQPGAFKSVAQEGRAFAEKYLSIHSVLDYTARLLTAYSRL